MTFYLVFVIFPSATSEDFDNLATEMTFFKYSLYIGGSRTTNSSTLIYPPGMTVYYENVTAVSLSRTTPLVMVDLPR